MNGEMSAKSGPHARPMHPDWARSIRDQCAAAQVPFFFKQWGEWGDDTGPLSDGSDPIMSGAAQCAVWTKDGWAFAGNGYDALAKHGADAERVHRVGKKRAGRLLDGVEHHGFPALRREAA